jgi:hypothetical protein
MKRGGLDTPFAAYAPGYSTAVTRSNHAHIGNITENK